jgi:multiple sugar transport system substrate-binding protein
MTTRRAALRAIAAGVGAAACGRVGAPREDAGPGPVRVVWKHQPMWGDPAPLAALLRAFERDNPDVVVTEELLPNASDVLHQYLLTTLAGGAAAIDVFVADVIWVAELARAGWLADLSDAIPPAEVRRDFLPAAAEAALPEGRTRAVPWYVDVGVLYSRVDRVPRPPRTYDELEASARAAGAPGSIGGYVWQARQYEGLVVAAFEAIWGHGGATFDGPRLALEAPATIAALAWLRRLVTSGVSPRVVLASSEEDTRRAFQEGRAVFMRNWPYAWADLEAPGSPVRGRVACTPLPTVTGEPGHGALGGWHLAVAASTPPRRREAATRLVRFLSSHEANVAYALRYGRNPARTSAYADARVTRGAPFLAGLREAAENARPRPVTPYYPMISDVLESELSAVVAGLRSPEEAMGRARALTDHVMGLG